jgi:serine/threonine protein kinase
LCRAISGESADAYARRLRVKLMIPESLHGLIDRSLDSSREDGIHSADEFLAALDQQTTRGVAAGGSTAAEAGKKGPTIEGRESESLLPAIDPTSSCISGIEARDERQGNRPGTEADSPLPFEKLGHYEIVSRLGQGGMGEVYLGYERSLDRWVAIKVLPARFARDRDLVRRFRSEATAAAKLIHPNIIQIYYIGEDTGHHFFAMQHVEGMSLASLLSKGRRLTLDESLAIIDEVLSGLVAAHRLNFVHRDIKPGNILLDNVHRRALLADFGLVKSLEESAAGHTSAGTVLGTVDYIAPEQGRGQAVDCRTDLYSVGVVLYQLLCGRLPFVAHESTAVIYQHVYEAPPPISTFAPEVPRALVAIVEKMLAKSPDDRYQTAAEALADVRAFRAGRPVSAGGVSNLLDGPASRGKTDASAAGPNDTATVTIQPTTQSAVAPTRVAPPVGVDRGRRRVALALAAAVPALAAGVPLREGRDFFRCFRVAARTNREKFTDSPALAARSTALPSRPTKSC